MTEVAFLLLYFAGFLVGVGVAAYSAERDKSWGKVDLGTLWFCGLVWPLIVPMFVGQAIAKHRTAQGIVTEGGDSTKIEAPVSEAN